MVTPYNLQMSIRRQWEPFVLRLQSKACRQTGFAVINVTFLVGPDGNPVLWGEPAMTKLEPLNGASHFLNHLMVIMSKDNARDVDTPD